MKKILPILMAITLTAASLAGCASNPPAETKAPAAMTTSPVETATAESDGSDTTKASAESEPEKAENVKTGSGTIRVGSLKGPTSIGLLSLMNTDSSANTYEFSMVTAADELVAMVASDKVDIALLPANVASVLYNKTNGGISVIDINTLGVLNIVSADKAVKSLADLKGKTIYMTGKGTVPDYVLKFLLKANNLSEQDVTLEYKSEPTEVAAILKEKENAVGLLPQPFATAACIQNTELNICVDLTKEWDQVQGENKSQLITGVTIVRNDFLKDNKEAIKIFLLDHKTSVETALANPDETAEQIVTAGIIEKAPVAKKALPYCNITYIDGEEMQTALSGYLNFLYEQDPKSVGGALPEKYFYYDAK